jgi:hypothetical protein
LNTRVAFKATNQFGTPVFIKGVLVNDKNKVLDTLKVKHDGMGSFYLKSNPLETYNSTGQMKMARQEPRR